MGRALAEAAAEAGDLVVATARRPEALAALATAYPGRLDARRLEVTDSAAIESLVSEVQKKYDRIDVW